MIAASTDTVAEHRLDICPLLVPDLHQFRYHIPLRLHLHLAGQSGIHILPCGTDGCLGPGCERQSVFGCAAAL